MKRLLFWLPRLLGILFALFVSLFAFDVFDGRSSVVQMLLAFAVHLIPVYAIVAALAIAWRWERAGAILFAALALAYPLAFGTRFPWSVYALMMGVPLLIGALFLASWLYRRSALARPSV